VGKTSLGKSIAKSTGRNFVRMSLGGVRDESEIRGHRRTYIGSMPGRIVQGMKKAKTSNPLFLLDEIDKLAHDWRGDPAAALLEVLDPEQNNTFNDHYLEVDYDLSDVMFICTANSLDLPRPLLDRMEIIRVAGYTEEEKLEIARRHLLDKTIEANGLKKGEFSINDAAMLHLIRYYTREAGVRSLERELSNLTRKAIKEIMLGKKDTVALTPKNIEKYAGVPRYRYGQAEEQDRIGCVTGLAWTEVGGDLLQIESVTFAGGKGKVSMTGKLGDVMKESIQVAEMLIKSRASSFGIKMETLETLGVHVHVPEGATPKDGPSAGIGMVTSIVSCLTGIAVRKDVAMTGEVDLIGQVLPIGGLKEKLLAALRGGITKVLIPKENVKDLAEIPDNVKKGLEIVPVTFITEVLSHALVRMPEPVEEKPAADVAAKSADGKGKDVIHH
jgi:ATP-dependent Lon protease